MTADHRALVERYVEALNRHDYLDELVTEDVVIEYPQSGEVIRGRDNLRGLIEHSPGGPTGADAATARGRGVDEVKVVAPLYTLVRVEGGGRTGSFEVRVHYPDGSSWWWVQIYELRAGRIAHSTHYFAQDFDAPTWRRPWVEVEQRR